MDEILEPFTQRREVEAEAGATPEIQPPAVAPAPPGPRTADDPPRPKIPDEHFEGMYAGLRLDDLVLAKSRVETEFFGLQNEAVLARFEVGQYESMIRERTEGGFSSGDFTPVPSGGLINSQQTQVLESGDLEVRTTTLPYADYIHVYDRQDELFWLNRRIAELQRGDR